MSLLIRRSKMFLLKHDGPDLPWGYSPKPASVWPGGATTYSYEYVYAPYGLGALMRWYNTALRATILKLYWWGLADVEDGGVVTWSCLTLNFPRVWKARLMAEVARSREVSNAHRESTRLLVESAVRVVEAWDACGRAGKKDAPDIGTLLGEASRANEQLRAALFPWTPRYVMQKPVDSQERVAAT